MLPSLESTTEFTSPAVSKIAKLVGFIGLVTSTITNLLLAAIYAMVPLLERVIARGYSTVSNSAKIFGLKGFVTSAIIS